MSTKDVQPESQLCLRIKALVPFIDAIAKDKLAYLALQDLYYAVFNRRLKVLKSPKEKRDVPA